MSLLRTRRFRLAAVCLAAVLVAGGLLVLYSYRQWQQEIRKAAGAKDDGSNRVRGLQGTEPWSHNPFSARNVDRL